MGKRMIGIFLLIVVLFSLFTACGKQEMNYHTEWVAGFVRTILSSNPYGSGLKGSFVEENVTQGVYPSGCQQQERYLLDRSNPSQRCYVIKDQIRLEEVFDEPPAVDFETQMVVVTFKACKQNASYRPKNVYYEERKLIFEIEKKAGMESIDPGVAQLVCVYRMDKLDEIEDIEILFVKA